VTHHPSHIHKSVPYLWCQHASKPTKQKNPTRVVTTQVLNRPVSLTLSNQQSEHTTEGTSRKTY